MKKLILAGLILTSSQMAMAVNWIDTGIIGGEDKGKNYIDWDTLHGNYFNNYNKNSYYVTAWVKTNYPVAQKLRDGRLYKERRELWYIDCQNRKTITGDAAVYNASKLVFSASHYVPVFSSDNWNKVIPDTVGEGLMKSICDFYSLKSNMK